MHKAITVSEFLVAYSNLPVIDVRTPAEFGQGHIPGAINIPLFNNDERAVIGTLYKKEGKQPAILKGLELVGPKLRSLVEEAQKYSINNTVVTHCWRGGMRSGSFAWLLQTYGINVFTLKGGYKFFRREVLDIFKKPYTFNVLGGKTGSAKSKVLSELHNHGTPVLDLEKLANHKGSSYGHLGEEKQPTQEMFENMLAMELLQFKPALPIWVEDESRLIGNKVIPNNIFLAMRSAKVFYLDVDFTTRVNYLTQEYGKFTQQELIDATLRIEKRLGPEQTKTAVEAIRENDLQKACSIILFYYDKAYDHGLSKRKPEQITKLNYTLKNINEVMESLLKQ